MTVIQAQVMTQVVPVDNIISDAKALYTKQVALNQSTMDDLNHNPKGPSTQL